MKNFRVVILAFVMGVVALTPTRAFSSNPDSFKEEINKLLQGMEIEIEEDIVADVFITFNKNNEIVVLSVETESDFIGELIKSRLNYKKLNSVLDTSVKEYKLPIRLKA